MFDEKEHGLTEEVLANTDVLVFWNHMLQEEFSDDVAERVRRHVLAGMGAGSSAFRALFQDYAEASRNKYDASVAAWGS